MPEHLSSEDLERFRKREIPPSQLVQCYDHLAVCEACRAQVGKAVKPRATLSALLTELGTEEFDHLEYERVAAYVDGLLGESEREVVASHLEVCVACRERAQELRVFRAELAGDPETRSAAAERSTFWQKLVRFWRVPVHWVPVQLAATVLIIGLCVWAMFVLRARIANLEAERNRLKQANEELEGERDTVAELRARLESLQAENETLRSQGLIALND